MGWLLVQSYTLQSSVVACTMYQQCTPRREAYPANGGLPVSISNVAQPRLQMSVSGVCLDSSTNSGATEMKLV